MLGSCPAAAPALSSSAAFPDTNADALLAARDSVLAATPHLSAIALYLSPAVANPTSRTLRIDLNFETIAMTAPVTFFTVGPENAPARSATMLPSVFTTSLKSPTSPSVTPYISPAHA